MTGLVTTLHILTCLALIAIVLLQHGKGADIGVQLGGGSSQTVFGARGAGSFLTKLTTGAAIVFMVTSFFLARLAGNNVDDVLAPPTAGAPAESPAAAGDAEPLGPPAESDTGLEGFEEIDPPTPAGPPAETAPSDSGG